MLKKVYFIFLPIIICFQLHAAAPLTHLFFADLFCDLQKIPELEKKLILRGSTFPDIYYITKKPREKTHKTELSLEEIILCNNAFEKGCLIHNYIDIIRAKIVDKKNLFNLIENISFGHKSLLLKFIEDELLFEKIDSCKYQNIFMKPIYRDEINTGIEKEFIDKFNQSLYLYLGQKPSELFAFLAHENYTLFGIEPKILKIWSESIPKLAKNPKIENYFFQLIEDLKKNQILNPN